VPKDLKINGKQETFTVSVVYETHELYGTVKASRTVTISAE
jgi:hypothetical protein